jgi:hypothetical protein
MQISNQITKRLPRILGLIALLTCVPLTARADAGTPLMWAGMLHMVFGNAIIGIFEGLILARVFKLKSGKCVLVMICANYFSAWGGELFLNYQITKLLPFNLYNALEPDSGQLKVFAEKMKKRVKRFIFHWKLPLFHGLPEAQHNFREIMSFFSWETIKFVCLKLPPKKLLC